MMRLQEKFRTPRLLLTRIGHDDLDDMLAMHRDARVAEALGGMHPASAVTALIERLVQQWETHGFGWWTMRDPVTGRYIGRGGLRPLTLAHVAEVELGSALLPEFWNRGLATELARVSVAQGFVRLGLAEVVSLTLPTNHGSRRVMEKTGMRYEREIVHAGRPHLLYRLTSASWRAGSPAARSAHPAEELVAG
jgi:RimJ/RimL family protein N-acetyltransferase